MLGPLAVRGGRCTLRAVRGVFRERLRCTRLDAKPRRSDRRPGGDRWNAGPRQARLHLPQTELVRIDTSDPAAPQTSERCAVELNGSFTGLWVLGERVFAGQPKLEGNSIFELDANDCTITEHAKRGIARVLQTDSRIGMQSANWLGN